MSCGVNFHQKIIAITSSNNQNEVIMTGPKQNGLYILNVTTITSYHAYATQTPQNHT